MARASAYAAIGAVTVVITSGILVWWQDPAPLPRPQTVRLSGGPQEYRPAGEFRLGTRVVDAPALMIEAPAVEVMKYQVSQADYALCVTQGACRDAPAGNQHDLAQTNVNYIDATDYAHWFSHRTGLDWRLPTDAEWLWLAGDRGYDDGFSAEANGADPSRRWIASYRREVALRGDADLTLHGPGHFGVNDRGVADIAGNVWEWTESCFQHGTVSDDGLAIATQSDYCGVRAVQGRHRGFVIDFVRDARSGGCGAGVPPDYLGFRLMRIIS